MDVSGGSAVRAGRREWLGLAVLCLPTMLLMVDINVLFLALPHLTADLGASSTQQLWVTDIYGFMIAGFLVTMGTLGDRIGRRKVLLVGAVAFCAASILAAYSTSPEMLIAARALLGIAGATVMPSTLALIMNMFPDPKQMGSAIAVWATALVVGVATGPTVGGVLLDSFWWGSVFLLAVPVMALLFVTGPALLPEYRDPNGGRLDPASVVLSLATILPVVWALKELARDGWATAPLIAAAAGLLVGVVFVRRQRGLDNPLLDVKLFSNRSFSGAALIGMFNGLILAGTGLVIALYLQMVLGLSPLEAGLWLLPPAAALVVGINVTPKLNQTVRPAHILVVGLVLATAGQLLLTQVGVSSLALVIVSVAIIYLGTSPIGPMITNLILGSAPPEKAGSASSLSSTGGELGVALGIAGMGSIAAVVYGNNVVIPAGVTGETAAVAEESIAGAVTAASGLPAQVAADLLVSAREAFVSGLHSVAIVGACLFVVLGVLAATTLRHVGPLGAHAGQAPEETEAVADAA